MKRPGYPRFSSFLILALWAIALEAGGQGIFTVQVSSPGAVNGAFVFIVQTNSITLSGTNTVPGSKRVLVNGADASFEDATGAWSLSLSLSPGLNRLMLQATDASGIQLLATNRDVVVDLSPIFLGGNLETNTAFSNSAGVFRVTHSLVVPHGGNLSIGPGCVFLVSPGASFLLTNATLAAMGEKSAPIYFAPADGVTPWGGLRASGTNGHLTIRHAEIVAGHVALFDGAAGNLEDSYLHDYSASSPPLLYTLGQPQRCSLTLLRCHLSRYYEILCQLTVARFEDCLMEHLSPGGDGIDFDAGQPGSVIRRCTIRHGRFTNIDALDMGIFSGTGEASRGITIDSCLIYDFVDKGVSIGEQADVAVTNCLIYGVDAAIAVKDLSTAGIYNCTIVSNNFGFHCFNKVDPASATGGGSITNSYNNILWHNREAVSLLNSSVLTASYSDLQNTNFPGPGNVSLDPAFLDPAALDFRLAFHSSLLSAGSNGSSMGVTFPVGSLLALSHPQFDSVECSGDRVTLAFRADSERSYSVLGCDTLTGDSWTSVANIHASPLPKEVEIVDSIGDRAARFYRLVTPALP